MVDNEHLRVDEEVVEQLASIAATMTSMLAKMMETHEVQSKDLEHFRDELRQVRNALRHIAKVLHEGNGERPLIARVAVLEEKADNIEDRVAALEDAQIRQAEIAAEQGIIDRKGKYAIATAVVSGIIALITSIVNLL